MSAQTVLATNQLGVTFGGLQAVRDLDLAVPAGEIRGLIGPNGAGKTTVFNLISGFVRPTHGSVEFLGKRVDRLSAHQMTRRGMARTFQTPRLFPNFTAYDNLRAAQSAAGNAKANRKQPPIDWAMDLVGLSLDRRLQVAELTQRDRKWLTIAMAMVSRPKLLLLDEPAAGLTAEEGAQLMDVVLHLRDAADVTIVLIEHKMHMVMRVCDNITVLSSGVKLSEGTPGVISQDESVIEAYLGVQHARG
jgi:branched-chain amino acid transport system ATP-binding protein